MSEEEKQIEICSFCGTHKDKRKKLIVSGEVAICDHCIDLCNDLMINDVKPDSEIIESLSEVDALEIYSHLNNYVIGQDAAKKILSVAIANHYKRISKPSKDIEIQKGNVLLLGPTGSGKTLLAKSAARFLKVPFVIADATSLTEAGYVGDDVESMIAMLLQEAGGDIPLAERGIIFIDEIDKIARKGESTSITRDVSGEGVQQALLKLIEGTKCRIPANGGRKHPDGNMNVIDTRNILFIVGGAFVGMKDIIKTRIQGTGMGFNATVRKVDDMSFLSQVNPDDLTKEQLIEVMTKVKNNFIDQYKFIFGIDGIKLKFSKGAVEAMADNCIKLKTGARGIQSEIERVLLPHMFYVKKYKKNAITEINISLDQVNNPKELI